MKKSDYYKPSRKTKERLRSLGKVLLILVTLPLTINVTTDSMDLKIHSIGAPYLGVHVAIVDADPGA